MSSKLHQILEGTEYATQELFLKISKDKRHRGVTLISNKPIEQRDFPEFKMGFRRACRQQLSEQIPHFSKIVEANSISPEELKGHSKLVATFIKTFARTSIHRFGAAS